MANMADKPTEQRSDDDSDELDHDAEVERSRFGSYTQSGTFVGTGDFHPDPVRALVADLAEDVSAVRSDLAELSEEVAAIRQELVEIGRLVVGLHEILVRMDKAN